MTGDKLTTFRVDNILLEHLDRFGKITPKPGQVYLPGMEPLGPFDLWLALGCYSMLDPKDPTAKVITTMTEVLDLLRFSRVLAESDGDYGWMQHRTDAYVQVHEAFHRLRTVEFPLWEKRSTRIGNRRRKVVYGWQTGFLSAYAPVYEDDVIPPDQLPASKRKNVNRALTTTGDPGPEILVRNDIEPIGWAFHMSPPVVEGLTATGKESRTGKAVVHIGATVFPTDVFGLREPLARFPAATKLLCRTVRQTKRQWVISLDLLVKQVGLGMTRNVTRDRQSTLKAVALLQELGVVEGFDHDQKTDKVVIVKAEDWHFPRRGKGKNDDEGVY